MVQKAANQPNYFVRYLSLAPVLAVVSLSIALSVWMIFNYFCPDLIAHPLS